MAKSNWLSDWIGDDQPYTDDSFEAFLELCQVDDELRYEDRDFDGRETVIEL